MKIQKFLIAVLLILNNLLMAQLTVDVKNIQPEYVGCYEKIEIELNLQNVSYTNPYNPGQIDVMGFFTSPSDSTWPVFAFYDNFQARDRWLLRFAANERGNWHFRVRVINQGDTAWSPQYSFSVDSSRFHGWIRVSEKNPHYFEYDDGTPFYGVGAYYPWGVNNGPNGLALLQNSGANIFGYWNIMYGDEKGIIESLDSGLGRYDQTKCGRIDQVLQWAEERNLKMMLAIWPHDLLSNTVWAHQWHNNPYKYVCNAEDFYASEEAWRYQQRQYRYLIARWGYSRALAIWEIVNEINGTDGWQKGHQQEATNWLYKVGRFFRKNDPHQRPCTASQSGGIYWSEGYQLVDVPNVHLYETSWSAPFPGNSLRSSAQLYYDIACELRNDFQKPAILGEAGYLDTFGGFDVPSPEYTQLYHNALWAGWAGGYATTPFWWSFASSHIMSSAVMDQMKAFSKVAGLIDYVNHRFEHFNEIQEDVDVYALKSTDFTFGWVRESAGRPVAFKVIHIDDLVKEDTVFSVKYFNTWTGEIIGHQFMPSTNGKLIFVLPDDGRRSPDQAFVVEPVAYGTIPEQLQLFTPNTQLFAADTSLVPIYCYIKDRDGYIVKSSMNIHFYLQGEGRLSGQNPVPAENGMAAIRFQADGNEGVTKIFATAAGLTSDTLTFYSSDEMWIDTFEAYASNIALNSSWQVRGGTSAELFLDQTEASEGAQSLRVTYAIGNGHAYYAGFFKHVNFRFAGASVLSFWIKDDNSQRDLVLVARDTTGNTFQYVLKLAHPTWQKVTIPFKDFNAPQLTSANLAEISFNVLSGQASSGSGWLKLDAISLKSGTTGLVSQKPGGPQKIKLLKIYPNPFNRQTKINFTMTMASRVKLIVFDILGQQCTTLMDGPLSSGEHSVIFQAQGLASGIYFLMFKMNKHTQILKLVLLK